MTAHPLILPSAALPESLHDPLCTFYTSFQPAVFCRGRPMCLPENSSL